MDKEVLFKISRKIPYILKIFRPVRLRRFKNGIEKG